MNFTAFWATGEMGVTMRMAPLNTLICFFYITFSFTDQGCVTNKTNLLSSLQKSISSK